MMFYFSVVLFFFIPLLAAEQCSNPNLSRCSCGVAEYFFKKYYIVNCTNSGFTNTTPLQKLPEDVEVLIFTGNNIPELPLNLFGNSTNSHLKIIDMSNNKIKAIHGKSFHKVLNVERLVLNHNELTIDDNHHPRMFSNFENLLELHLTDAFNDENPADFAEALHDIFLESDLVKLQKIHLEQNEIESFKDPQLFCALVNLMDLHLSDNKLQHINFKITCLKHLRFIGLERNSIVYLNKEELSLLDTLPKRRQNLMLDLTDNPFSCVYRITEFFSWLNNTSVNVRNKYKLKCKHDPHNDEEPLMLNLAGHACLMSKATPPPPEELNLTVPFLSVALLFITFLLLYTNKEGISAKLLPIVLSLSRKVHYTTIGKPEAHEMEV